MADLIGADALQKTLNQIGTITGPKIGKKAAGAGARKIAAGIRRHVPQKRIKQTVRSRNVKGRRGQVDQAKAGFNVGIKRPQGKDAKPDPRYLPHAHLLALGTAERTRRKIGGEFRSRNWIKPDRRSKSTGQISPSGAVPKGVAASQAAALQAMIDTAKKEIAKIKPS